MPRSSNPPPRAKSKVSNGNKLFAAADGRSLWARRFRDIYSAHIADLGGAEMLSEGRLQLCRRAAAIAIECERLESRLAAGEEADVDQLSRLVGILGRTLERIGIDRVPKEVKPLTIAEHFAKQRAAS